MQRIGFAVPSIIKCVYYMCFNSDSCVSLNIFPLWFKFENIVWGILFQHSIDIRSKIFYSCWTLDTKLTPLWILALWSNCLDCNTQTPDSRSARPLKATPEQSYANLTFLIVFVSSKKCIMSEGNRQFTLGNSDLPGRQYQPNRKTGQKQKLSLFRSGGKKSKK